MKKSTIVILVLSGIILLQIVLLSNFYTRFLLLDLIEPNDPDDAYVLTNDVFLASHLGHKIRLPSGTILHGPCRHDLVYTDLGDPRVWKVFVESDHGELQQCAMPLSDAPKDFPFNGIMDVELTTKQEISEPREDYEPPRAHTCRYTPQRARPDTG